MNNAKWKEILLEAKQKTDKELSSEISGLCRLTDEEIENIAPSAGEKETLVELMKIVKDAESSNSAKADALKNIKGAAEIAVKLIGKVI